MALAVADESITYFGLFKALVSKEEGGGSSNVDRLFDVTMLHAIPFARAISAVVPRGGAPSFVFRIVKGSLLLLLMAPSLLFPPFVFLLLSSCGSGSDNGGLVVDGAALGGGVERLLCGVNRKALDIRFTIVTAEITAYAINFFL